MNSQLQKLCNLSRFTNVANNKKYKIFQSPNKNFKPYNLNIWVVRSDEQHAGKFDDVLCLFYTDKDRISRFHTYSVTADPSDLSLLKMNNKLGVAIIKPGQYLGSHVFGKHKNSYPALVQNKPITVIRDYNKDTILDVTLNSYFRKHEYKDGNSTVVDYYDADNKLIFREHTGIFGINIHRASAYKILESVGLYSEGCVVFQDPKEYQKFIDIIQLSIPYYNNSFTLTLITENQLMSSNY